MSHPSAPHAVEVLQTGAAEGETKAQSGLEASSPGGMMSGSSDPTHLVPLLSIATDATRRSSALGRGSSQHDFRAPGALGIAGHVHGRAIGVTPGWGGGHGCTGTASEPSRPCMAR